MTARHCIYLLFFSALAGSACRPIHITDGAIELEWRDISADLAMTDTGITVYSGQDKEAPLRAWYAKFDPQNDLLSPRVIQADDNDKQMAVSELASGDKACLAVNAGYFYHQRDTGVHIGLLVHDGQVLSGASERIVVADRSYRAVRSAVGFLPDGSADIAWVTSRRDSVFAWSVPVPNRPSRTAEMPSARFSRYWPVEHAVAAGPMLFRRAGDEPFTNEEVFFETPIPNIHPRSAIGITESGDVIVMVVDGRQSESRGVSLAELGRIMRSVGAVKAINLDGGGSSALVINGELINRPLGHKDERPVVSAITVHCLSDQ